MCALPGLQRLGIEIFRPPHYLALTDFYRNHEPKIEPNGGAVHQGMNADVVSTKNTFGKRLRVRFDRVLEYYLDIFQAANRRFDLRDNRRFTNDSAVK